MADDNNNKLKTAAIAAPSLIGAGLAAKAAWQEKFSLLARESSVASAMKVLSTVTPRTPEILSPEYHIAYMNQNARHFSTTEGAQQAKMAWAQAIKGVDALASSPFKEFTAGLGSMPPEQAPSAIAEMMGRNQSSLSTRLYQRYYSHLELLKRLGPAQFTIPERGAAVKGFRALPGNLSSRMQSIEQQLGALSTYQWISRPGWGEDLGSWSVKMQVGGRDINFLLPNVSEGILTEGGSLRTRYLARNVGIFDPRSGSLSRMSRSEFFLHEIEKSVVPDILSGQLKTQRDIERAIQQVRGGVIHSLETIPNVPFGQLTPAEQDLVNIKRGQLQVLVEQGRREVEGDWKYRSAYRVPSAQELSSAMKQHTLYGGTSPSNIAEGIVQTQDLSKRFHVPGAADFGRNIHSMFREWGLTQEAREMLSSVKSNRFMRYRLYETEAMRQVEQQLLRPNARTLYLDPDRYARLFQELGAGEGEAVMRRGMASMLSFETTGRAHLSSLRSDLTEKLLAGEGVNVPAGEILGWTREGDPFLATKEMQDIRANVHWKDKTKFVAGSTERDMYYSLAYRNVHTFKPGDKMFLDLKADMMVQTEKNIRQQIRRHVSSARFLQGNDVIASMDTLKKDTGKFTTQILTGLADLAHMKAQRLGPQRLRQKGLLGLEEFAANPQQMSKLWEAAATTNNIFSREKYVQQAMTFALAQANATPSEFGGVFGSVPYVLGGETSASLVKGAVLERNAALKAVKKKYLINEQLISNLTGVYTKALEGGSAVGIAKLSFGGPNISSMGSVEPRMFDIFHGPAYAGVGDAAAKEFAERLAYTNPEKLAIHRALSRSIASMAGKEGPRLPGEVWKVGQMGFRYSPEEFEKFIGRGGGYISPGKGLRDIYVPGGAAISAMRPTEVGGTEVRTQLSDIYHSLARGLEGMYSETGAMTQEEGQKLIESTAARLWTEAAPGGKGMGAVLRGKMAGSRFLRSVSKLGNTRMADLAKGAENLQIAGLPPGAAEPMFKEMEQIYGVEAMAGQRARYEAGQEIPLWLWRHPAIGEFSTQMVRARKVRGPGNQILLPEARTSLTARLSSGELIQKEITVGPLLGQAADKDADMHAAALVAPDNERAIMRATRATDSEFLQRYQQHQVRYQLLKAAKANKALDAGMTIEDLMIANTQKLGTVQRWTPALSLEMSGVKRALRSVGGAGAADAAMLTEWLEQMPISSKHYSAREARDKLEASLSAIVSAPQMRDEQRLKDVIYEVMNKEPIARELLVGNVQIQSGGEELARLTGGRAMKEIEGVNIDRAVSSFMTALREHASSGEARAAELAVGRGKRLSIQEVPELMARGVLSMNAGSRGMLAEVSRAATAASNIIAAAGRSAIRNYKPLGLGFAASLGIAAMLSSPPPTIGAGGTTIPRVNLPQSKASDRMSPESVAAQQVGRPAAPPPIPTPRALIQQNQGSKYAVNAMLDPGMSAAELSARVGAIGIRGPVNVNLRDSREIDNPYVKANRVR